MQILKVAASDCVMRENAPCRSLIGVVNAALMNACGLRERLRFAGMPFIELLIL